MKIRIKMELLSDVIFGNGLSIPGAEDISVLCDEHGFPYYKGGTFKGIFREELNRFLEWTAEGEDRIVEKMLGKSGDTDLLNGRKLVFSDFQLSDAVKQRVLEEIGEEKETVLDSMTHIRAFTGIEESGVVKEGSLRNCRCVNKGLYFYSEVQCAPEDEELVTEVLSLVKWIGSMRNRGFGKVRITAAEVKECQNI